MRHHHHRAFTLTELGATLAVIGLTVVLTLPALAQTRTQAQSAVAYANLKRMTDAQIAHAHANGLWLAGPNTTGWDSIITHGSAIEGNTTSSTPAETPDWISPTMGDELDLSPNRAERTRQILDFLADPRAVRPQDQLYAGSYVPSDVVDFTGLFARTNFLQVSYLAPAPFHFRPPYSSWSPDPNYENLVVTGFVNPVTTPDDYLPRLDLVGPPSMKVATADGTRYLATVGGPINPSTALDIEIASYTNLYGNFMSDAPTFDRSVAYGRSYLISSLGDENVLLSMRYPDPSSAFGRGMHVAHFDASVDFISAEIAWEQASLWYPTGSVFTGATATTESKAIYQAGEILP